MKPALSSPDYRPNRVELMARLLKGRIPSGVDYDIAAAARQLCHDRRISETTLFDILRQLEV